MYLAVCAKLMRRRRRRHAIVRCFLFAAGHRVLPLNLVDRGAEAVV